MPTLTEGSFPTKQTLPIGRAEGVPKGEEKAWGRKGQEKRTESGVEGTPHSELRKGGGFSRKRKKNDKTLRKMAVPSCLHRVIEDISGEEGPYEGDLNLTGARKYCKGEWENSTIPC